MADRVPEPAVQRSIAVDLTLIDAYHRLVTDLQRDRVNTAKAPEAQTFSRRRSLPGLGKLRALGLLDEIHDIHRVPRVQAVVSYGRRGTCTKESAGQRDGTAGNKLGQAYRQWTFSKAPGLCRRHNPAGQKDLARLESRHGTGTALTVLAHKLAPAVDYRSTRETAFDRDTFLHESWSGVGEPAASRDAQGMSLAIGCSSRCHAASENASEHLGREP